MKQNRITHLLGIQHPIIQGPFGGGISSVSLTSTVSNAGGMGSFGAHYMNTQQIESLVSDIRLHTQKPFAINLWVSDHDDDGLSLSNTAFEQAYKVLQPYFEELGLDKPHYPESFGVTFDEQIEGIFTSAPPVFSFVYGLPSPEVLKECAKRNITTIGTATTLDEAIALDDAGVDLIVATGFEAGGHRVSFLRNAKNSLVGTFALIPQVVDHVRAPIIAAR